MSELKYNQTPKNIVKYDFKKYGFDKFHFYLIERRAVYEIESPTHGTIRIVYFPGEIKDDRPGHEIFMEYWDLAEENPYEQHQQVFLCDNKLGHFVAYQNAVEDGKTYTVSAHAISSWQDAVKELYKKLAAIAADEHLEEFKNL